MFFIIIFTVVNSPFINSNKYLFFSIGVVVIFELFYVLYNFEIFGRKIIFQRNKKLGSNPRLKSALNVSKNLIR